jgi:hypothetical protein
MGGGASSSFRIEFRNPTLIPERTASSFVGHDVRFLIVGGFDGDDTQQ